MAVLVLTALVAVVVGATPANKAQAHLEEEPPQVVAPLVALALRIQAVVVQAPMEPVAQAVPGLSVSGGLNKENRNELRTHQQ